MRAWQQAFNRYTSPGWFLMIAFVGGMIVYGPAMEHIQQREQERIRQWERDTIQRNDYVFNERAKAMTQEEKARARQSRVWELEGDTLANAGMLADQ